MNLQNLTKQVTAWTWYAQEARRKGEGYEEKSDCNGNGGCSDCHNGRLRKQGKFRLRFIGCSAEGMVCTEPGGYRNYGGAAEGICRSASGMEHYMDHGDCGRWQVQGWAVEGRGCRSRCLYVCFRPASGNGRCRSDSTAWRRGWETCSGYHCRFCKAYGYVRGWGLCNSLYPQYFLHVLR